MELEIEVKFTVITNYQSKQKQVKMMSVENTIMAPVVVAEVAQAAKRGRPKKVVDPSAVKADAPVGRPKKSTKVTELARSEDLFLELVREASEPAAVVVVEEVKPQATQEEVKVDAKAEAKAAKEQAQAEAKAAKVQAQAEAKAAKEQAQAEAKAAKVQAQTDAKAEKEAIKAAKAAITPEMKE